MNSVTSRIRGARSNVAALLGTASFVALSSGAAQAQVAEVLITGSLIAGTTAVGVPITAVGEAEFLEQGAITVADMLYSVPSLQVDPSLTSLRGGGTTGYGQNVAIHGFEGSGGDAITLMLIDGGRWPIQGHGGDTVDPSIIPQLAVDRVDILTAGASAVYGADAIVGVINVVLKRNFEGAISQFNFSAPVHNSQGWKYTASHLHGISWDTGNITLTAEAYFHERVTAASVGRDKYTTNFSDFLGYDTTPVAMSHPGTLMIGRPIAAAGTPDGFNAITGTRYCDNCYSIPHGVGWAFGSQDPGPTTSWDAIEANKWIVGQRNEANQRINYDDGWANPQQTREAFVGTLDQELTDDFFGLGPVAFAGTVFYSNRKGQMHFGVNVNSGNSREHASFRRADRGVQIPWETNSRGIANPYIPSGIVEHLQAVDDAGGDSRLQMQINATPYLGSTSRISYEAVNTRYKFGFNFNALPFGWVGDMFYSLSDNHNNTRSTAMFNRGRAARALGNVVSGATKPDDVPFLNLFCDALTHGKACNSQITLDYIGASRLQSNQWRIRQMQVNTSGPLFELPTGEIQAALGFEHTSQHWWVDNVSNHGTAPPDDNPGAEPENAVRVAHAFFGQLNIPLLGGELAVPGIIEGLDVELGYRVDSYDFQTKNIRTPKVAATLFLGGGISLRGAWGKSFRAPGFGQGATFTGSRAIGTNILGGAGSDDFKFDCSNEDNSTAFGTAAPGSATARLNPGCLTGVGNELFQAPATIEIAGGAGLGSFVRGISESLRPGGIGKGLGPEQARQYVWGVNIAPLDGIFAGLNLDVSYFDIKISDTIRADESGGQDPDNPLAAHLFILRPSRVTPGADDTEFDEIMAAFGALQASTSTFDRDRVFDAILDGGNANLGFIQLRGIDWSFRYDWSMGDLGSFHVGNSGYYELDQKAKANELVPAFSFYDGTIGEDGSTSGRNSGSRLKRVRSRAGWTNGTWSTTLFATTQFHGSSSNLEDGNPNTNITLPDCFWRPGHSAGDCYSGSPFYPQANPDGGFYNVSPGWTQFDINITYNTGMMPANEYLQNLNISLTINNFLDADPPFVFLSRDRSREIRAYDDRFSELGRYASLTLTKTW